MFAFPKLSDIFSTIADRIPATVRTGGWLRGKAAMVVPMQQQQP